MPTRYTPSLTGTEEFVTDGDRLLQVIDKYWIEEDVDGRFVLDDWQRWLIRHVLERYPDDYPDPQLAGRLRWRQVVISMGRQNGKSVLGAIFGVYGLLFHMHAPRVVGLGYSQKTAKIVYDRVSYTINTQPVFKKVVRVTKVTGMKRKDAPGEYIIKPASEKAIQGFPITLCVFDEMHITPEALWNAAKQGMKTKEDGIIIGLTTAGDTNSVLLNKLYKELEGIISATAAADTDETSRLGGFIWEAPEGASLTTEGAVEAANPAVACGRVPVAVVRSDAASDPWVEQQRYVLNRFVDVFNSWIEMPLWNACVGKGPVLSEGGPYVFAIDAADVMNTATITMTTKKGDVVKSRMVASLVKPTTDQLFKYCKYLRKKYGRSAFVVYKRSLNELGEKLKEQGFEVYNLSDSEFSEACKTTYRLITRKQLEVRNEEVLKMQVPRAIRKNYYSGWKLDKTHTSVELDALYATVIGAYIAETKKIGQAAIW
jgi:phage terminase large subunit-like protein